MWIKKREIEELSNNIRKIIDEQNIDLRDNRESLFSILKNDIHTLASKKESRIGVLQQERDGMTDTLANISHQLKTPLASMMIMADLLENAPPEKQTEFIANIKIGLTRMEWLVSALLKMAKLDAGTIEFSKDSIQASALVNLALEPLHILLEIKSQEVEISCNTELICDKRWTAEALTNIIKNASEHSPNGSKIYIESGANPICKWVSVTDSGEGIANNEIPGMFRRFEGSTHNKGYGIGLPLALAIMQAQNGDIEVDGGGSGCGATFTLKFFV
ncbi:MAG: HAMP domain-containing histidine kinase [Defluviitaleaceae bacterium]|nr:HAMP domain-containing histidine kinase [Defluviitaleaceae bacterium]